MFITRHLSAAFLLALLLSPACAKHDPTGAPGADAAASGASAGGEARPLPGAVYGEHATSIHTVPGERFSIALPIAADGSLRWMLDPEHDQSVGRLDSEGTWDAAPASCETCGDATGGLHYFHFESVGIGPVDVRFRLKDPERIDQPHARELVLRLRVAGPNG